MVQKPFFILGKLKKKLPIKQNEILVEFPETLTVARRW
jgi:hypothetical protein